MPHIVRVVHLRLLASSLIDGSNVLVFFSNPTAMLLMLLTATYGFKGFSLRHILKPLSSVWSLYSHINKISPKSVWNLTFLLVLSNNHYHCYNDCVISLILSWYSNCQFYFTSSTLTFCDQIIPQTILSRNVRNEYITIFLACKIS